VSGSITPLRKFVFAVGCTAGMLVFTADALRSTACAQSDPATEGDLAPIEISSDFSHDWTSDNDTVVLLRGRCRIVQGPTTLTAQKAVLWRRTEKTGRTSGESLTVYLEGLARVERPGQTLSESALFVKLRTHDGVSIEATHQLHGDPAEESALYRRAQRRNRQSRREALLQTQMQVESEQLRGPEFPGLSVAPQAEPFRRVRIFSRNGGGFDAQRFSSNNTTPPEKIWVLSGGIRLLIDGADSDDVTDPSPFSNLGTVDLAADRMVIWTDDSPGSNGFSIGQSDNRQSADAPFTIYMEGHIVVRQGNRTVTADRATYDARDDRAMYYDVELREFVPELQADLRVRAERVRQMSRSSFHAQNAWITGSKFGVPGYRMKSKDIFLEERTNSTWLGTGTTAIDPLTGLPSDKPTLWATALNNSFLIEEIPLFYTPYLSAPAKNPQVPLRRVSVGYDRVFGGKLNSVWDMFQLIGKEEPAGMRWDLLLDAYSERGPAIGTATEYDGLDMFGVPGRYNGEGLLYYIHDDGKDNLGADRRSLEPKSNDRGRAQWRHMQELPGQMKVIGELGLLSDRNFLEQYYEDEFDEGKDVETLVYLKQQDDNWAWTVMGRPQLNDFDTTTQWYPKGDLYNLSEPLLGGLMTWSSHSSAGYANLSPSDGPTDPTEIFTPLPFVADVDGGVFMSRHELDAPFSLGPVHVVPFAMGEGAFWNEGLMGDDESRLVGRAGVRSSMLFWKVYPYVQSRVMNVNGLAHKIALEAEYAYTNSSRDLAEIAQYNEFDDNAQERFRQRLVTRTFAGTLPGVYEPRFYAVRTGAGTSVTSPYHELIDDQQVARLAIRQRLQTKVGPPDRMRIKNWMTLDLEGSLFPDASRDNFGEDIGLLGARYRWNVGDRTSFLANAYYDLFDGAQELWDIAILSQRSQRGSVYLGVRQVKAAQLDSQTLTVSYTYQMSPKWVSTAGTAYDIGEAQNRGQSLTVTRIGADFLWHLGANYDQSKNNAGFAFMIEPRFGALGGSPNTLGSLLQPGGR